MILIIDVCSDTLKVGTADNEKHELIIKSMFPLNNHSFPIDGNFKDDDKLH